VFKHYFERLRIGSSLILMRKTIVLSNYIFMAVGRVGSSIDQIVQRVEFVLDANNSSHLIDLIDAQKDKSTHGKQNFDLILFEDKEGS